MFQNRDLKNHVKMDWGFGLLGLHLELGVFLKANVSQENLVSKKCGV